MITNQLFFGVVEARNDPLKMGRCKVRVVGLHTHDRSILPTEDLPWASLMTPIASGSNPCALPPIEGSVVGVMFADYPDCQIPIVMGVIPHTPQQQSVFINEWP